MSWPSGAIPLLIGIWEESDIPVLACMDPEHRRDKPTRQSLFIPLEILLHASREGWSQGHNTLGELIIAFHPALLPAYVETKSRNVTLDARDMAIAVETSGMLEQETSYEGIDRARRAASRLVRSGDFSKKIREAYNDRCAVCDLSFGIVEGAHIYPVRAPNSNDETWNGIALCPNHHAIFDKFLMWISPESRRIYFHPNLLDEENRIRADHRFLKLTHRLVRVPKDSELAPKPRMFRLRYEFFKNSYAWFDAQSSVKIE